MSHHVACLVVGGGVIGLCAALAMRQRGLTVALADAGPLIQGEKRVDSRIYALNQASHALLQSLGVWPRMAADEIAPYRHMHVWDAANGAHIDFDSRLVGKRELGYILSDALLKESLLTEAAASGVLLLPQSRVSALEETKEALVIQCGHNTVSTQLLMVADGRASETRELLGVKTTSWPYHQQAIVATVANDNPHQHTAYQVFTQEGPLAFLPLQDSHQCSIVWSTSPQKSAQLMAEPVDVFSKELTSTFATTLGQSRLVSKRYQFPLHMHHVQQYSGKRWLIMGDAAHTIHPLAGQGLNLGLADLADWLTLLDGTKSGTWSPKLLGAYQRQRKTAVWKMISAMEGLKGMFSNPLPPIVELRRLGIAACNRSGWIKRFFIEQAAGKS